MSTQPTQDQSAPTDPQNHQPTQADQHNQQQPTPPAQPEASQPQPPQPQPPQPSAPPEATAVPVPPAPRSNGLADQQSRKHDKPEDPTAVPDEVAAEIDDAMAALGFDVPGAPKPNKPAKPNATQRQHAHDIQPIGGVQKPRLHGPRVVEAGRERRTGIIVSVGPTDVFVEFGPKELGVIPRAQWKEDQGDSLPDVGSDFEVVVDRYESSESIYVCSRPGAVVKAEWENLEIGQTVEARVTGTNKGGLELEVAGHRAFMPASQVSLDRVNDLSVFVGEKLACQVSQIDKRGRGNIVLSRRDVLQTEREEKAKQLRESLKEGDTLEGTVRKIMPFGAFVDLGGIDGLVHLADLSHDRVGYGEKNVEKHVKVGEHVKVKILEIDWDKNRISLGLKQLAEDPFAQVENQLADGAEVTGKVSRIVEFGAFIELAPGVEGLVHISEIEHRRIKTPADVLSENQVVKAKVLRFEPDTRRISLSIKALTDAPQPQGGRGTPGRTEEQIREETPAQRRAREKAKGKNLKGGFGDRFDDGGGLAGLRLG